GFVFQFHHLLRDFTARENVMMPLLIGGATKAEAARDADQMLERVGLSPRASARVTLLSGGEQQRVAFAPALGTKPAVILADEPTGNLDPHTAAGMHDLLCELTRSTRTAVVTVTHNRGLAQRADRVLTLEDGELRNALAAEMLP